MDLQKYFEQLRFNKNHHIGLGDIRLTIAQQEEIVANINKLIRKEAFTIFWQETARLMQEYRTEGNEERVQGIVDCRILFNRLFS